MHFVVTEKGKRGARLIKKQTKKQQHLAGGVSIHSSSVADISGYWQEVEHAVANIDPEHPNMLSGGLAS